VSKQEAQQSYFLVYQPLVLGERMAFARLRESHPSAPCVWVFAAGCSRSFDLREFLIIQAKGDVLRSFGSTHFCLLVSDLTKSSKLALTNVNGAFTKLT
jgi:hypothetical protein